MRVTMKFEPYNPKRRARPYIAKVVGWPVGRRAQIEWGTYLGDEGGGEAEVEARPGDVVRHGQRDERNHKGNAKWAVVQADGALKECTELEAARTFRGGALHCEPPAGVVCMPPMAKRLGDAVREAEAAEAARQLNEV
jgi:hypothetical protein